MTVPRPMLTTAWMVCDLKFTNVLKRIHYYFLLTESCALKSNKYCVTQGCRINVDILKPIISSEQSNRLFNMEFGVIIHYALKGHNYALCIIGA